MDDIEVTPALAEAVKTARGDLSVEDLKQRGGPSGPTMTKIELVRGKISPKSAAKLETALGWQEGDVRRAAAGLPLAAKSAIQQVREERGLSRFEMAKFLEVSAARIDRWETGQEPMPEDVAEALMELFPADAATEAIRRWLRISNG